MTPPSRQAVVCRPVVRTADRHVDLSALANVVAEKDCPAILGGNPSVSNVSIFAAEPVETFEFHLHQNDPFAKLHRFLSRYVLAPDSAAPHPFFCGGWIGFFGYELGRFIEKLPQRAIDDIGLPVIRLAFYDKVIVFDHARNTFIQVVVDMQGREPVAAKMDRLGHWLDQAARQPTQPDQTAIIEPADRTPLHSTMTESTYAAALQDIQRHIFDGDVYQINFSQRFSTPYNGRPIDLFNWLNRCNPSPYAAYLAWDRSAVVSASPELFLEIRGDRIRTCPIKGTRRRDPALSDDAPTNRAYHQALLDSEKDRAELAMIVDLERNDLARVCLPGTRQVSSLRHIEAFPTVYHAVATVEGTLAARPGPARIEALLRATFPGGSITGAPKIRAMEIIDALEPTARSVYTGAIGWIGLNFDLCLNIAIRTVLIQNNIAYIQTGGGIVADSNPQDEWDETLTKAYALLAGISNTHDMFISE